MPDALTELRFEIEDAGTRPGLSAASRNAKLRILRDGLEGLLGRIDTYEQDNEREREAVALGETLDRLKLHADAALGAELVRRGVTTEAELVEAGLLTEQELAYLTEEGLLGRTGSELTGSAKGLFEKQHPRGRGGKWIEVFGAVKKLNDGGQHNVGGNVAVRRKGEQFHVVHKGRTVHKTSDATEAAKHATDRAALIPRRRPKSKGQPAPNAQELRDRLYQERRAHLEKMVGEQVPEMLAKASPAELHFNQAGKVSQATLGNYARMVVGGPDTTDEWSAISDDGERVWDASRRELHAKIIDMFLRQRRFDPEADGGKGAWVICEDCPEFQPAQGSPEVLFSGGGYATGKSSTLAVLRARGQEPDSGYEGPALTLDPDVVKSMLPEFVEGLETDPAANAKVYREAWEISQEIQRRAQQKRLNIVVDGISNTSPDEFLARVDSFHKAGYTGARVVYTDIPTEEAMQRAAKRASAAKKPEDKRMIPEVVMRSVSRDVSAMVPHLADVSRERGIDLTIEVYDNNQGQDENGSFLPPKRFFYQEPQGEAAVEDEALWERFRSKRHEDVVQAEPRQASRRPTNPAVGDLSDDELAKIVADAPPDRLQWSARETAAWQEQQNRRKPKG